MAKVTIVGTVAVITSAMLLEDIKLLSKYNPKALQLVEKDDDGNKNAKFAIGVGPTGSINAYGASFASADKDGFAQITVQLGEGLSNDRKVELVQDKFGFGLLNLAKIEAQIGTAADSTRADFNAMKDMIEVG